MESGVVEETRNTSSNLANQDHCGVGDHERSLANIKQRSGKTSERDRETETETEREFILRGRVNRKLSKKSCRVNALNLAASQRPRRCQSGRQLVGDQMDTPRASQANAQPPDNDGAQNVLEVWLSS